MSYRVFRSEEVDWCAMPGHTGAYCKYLMNADNGSKYVDFRISIYAPKGFAECHYHEEAENIFFILKGKGIFELDGERILAEPNMVVFIPPKVKHAIYNTGYEDLICIVVAAPPSDMPR